MSNPDWTGLPSVEGLKRSTVETTFRPSNGSGNGNDHWRRWWDKNIHVMDKPEVYLGTEPGTEFRDWGSAPLRVCIVGGSTYENLTGNLAVPMIYRLLLERIERPIVIDRAFMPHSRWDLDLFERNRIPIFGVQYKRRLTDFDVIAFSCSFQGVDLNVIKMLDMSGIPVRREDRDKDPGKWPLLVRGGQNDANPAPFMSIHDICWVGEAEQWFPKFINRIVDLNVDGKFKENKKKLYPVAKEMEGVLVCEKYELEFFKDADGVEKVKGWKVKDGYPLPVKAPRMWKPEDEFIYTTPVVNFLETMGSGEILLSRGCLARCSFCLEGAKEKPYREMPPDQVVKVLSKSLRESGAKGVTLSAFCTSSYRNKNTVLRRILEEVTPEIGLTSQRVAESAEDFIFMRLSALAGNRSVSFGVEGVSERLRTQVNKWATEDQIVEAVKNAIAGGYNKIKLFMISNLPGENDEDREEIVRLAKRLREVRDRYPERKVQIRFNWTDLTICPWTSYQWLKPQLGGRHLSPFLKRIQEYGFRVGFGAGKGQDLDSLLQFLHIADTRHTEVLIDLVLKDGVTYFRQVSGGTFGRFKQRLESMGLRFEDVWRDKSYDEALAWDILDFGITKKSLQLQAELAFRENPRQLPTCDDKCYACGIVQIVPGIKRQCGLSYEREQYNNNPPKVMKFEPVGQSLLLKLRINDQHRFVNPKSRGQLVRRMLYRHDVPFTREVEVATDSVRQDDWVYGVDYAAVRLTKRMDVPPVIVSDNNVFDVEEIKLVDTEQARLFGGQKCISELKIVHPVRVIKKAVEDFRDVVRAGKRPKRLAESHIAVLKLVKQGYLGTEAVLVWGPEYIHYMKVVQRDDGFWLLAVHDTDLSIYDIYAKFSKGQRRLVASCEARRLDFVNWMSSLGADRCPVTNTPLRRNPFGEEWSVPLGCKVGDIPSEGAGLAVS